MAKDEVKKPGGALVPAGGNTALATVDYGDDVGAGFENQTRDDVALPFVDVLHFTSPECTKTDNDGNQVGEKPGSIINRTTGEIFPPKEGILFIPAVTEHCYTEWRKRAQDGSGGGFVARHELSSPLAQKARAESPFKAMDLGNGNELVESFYVFGTQVYADGHTQPIGLAFVSTRIKSYKSWMYIARSIQVLAPNGAKVNPPLFSHCYRLTSELKQQGTMKWFIWNVGFAKGTAEASRLKPDDPLYIEARRVRDSFNAGVVKADYAKTTTDASDRASAGGGGSGGAAGGKAPF